MQGMEWEKGRKGREDAKVHTVWAQNMKPSIHAYVFVANPQLTVYQLRIFGLCDDAKVIHFQ
jgi:hypothetical protein